MMLQWLTNFVACSCDLDQRVDYLRTFSSMEKYHHTLQSRKYMRETVPPKDKKRRSLSVACPPFRWQGEGRRNVNIGFIVTRPSR